MNLFCLSKSGSSVSLVLLLGCSFWSASWVHAQIIDVTDCRAITDSLARLVCYDSGEPAVSVQSGTSPTPSASASASVPAVAGVESASGVTEAPAQTESGTLLERGRSLPLIGRLFGADKDQAQDPGEPEQAAIPPDVEDFGLFQSTAARVQAADGGQVELHDSIAALDRDRKGNWRITLTSGQVWLQVFEKQFLLREGQAVRIYSTSWGDNFRLSADGRSGFIQVKRLDQPD